MLISSGGELRSWPTTTNVIDTSGRVIRSKTAPARADGTSAGAAPTYVIGTAAEAACAPTYAVLQDPARLAIGLLDKIEIIDVATGETQEHVTLERAVPMAWTRDGVLLLAGTPTELVLIGGRGEIRRIHLGDRPLAVWAGRTAAFVATATGLSVIDLENGERYAHSVLELRDLALSDRLSCGAMIYNEGAFALFHPRIDRIEAESAPELLPGNRELRRVWGAGEYHLLRIATLDTRDELRSFESTSADWRAVGSFTIDKNSIVDVVARRVLSLSRGTAILRDLTGRLLGKASRATAVSLAGSGVAPAAVVLVDGVAHTLEGGPALLAGPTDLVRIGHHPRGVVALDMSDRVHVIETQ